MNRIPLLMFGSLAVVCFLALALRSNRPQPDRPESRTERPAAPEASTATLTIYCAASNRPVMEAIRADYEAEFNVKLQIEYGPSQTLLATHEVSRIGDLFLPADASYIEQAREKKLIDEVLPLGQMHAVLGVTTGNPKQIKSLADLLRDDVQLVQANPEAAAIGAITKAELSKADLWEKLAAKSAFKTTVNEVANDLKVGAADVGVVFDVVLKPMKSVEAVEVPELRSIVASVSLSVLKSSKQPQRALHFARYMQAKDRGQKRYHEFGFEVPERSDEWADSPELTLFAGSMLRPAIETTIQQFEKREGVAVVRSYNGCGILVTQMKAGKMPDAYFACDQEFMDQVHELFKPATKVSQNELVIIVTKGNPQGIKSLRDLAKSGLRIGIGHEKQCAMGWLTQKTLKESQIQDSVMKNVVVQTPTGDMLVNQMKTGSLDAAVVYLSNAAGAGDTLSAIRIKDIPCSIATQPLAIATSSKYPQLTGRLEAALKSAESKHRFETEGFRWQAP